LISSLEAKLKRKEAEEQMKMQVLDYSSPNSKTQSLSAKKPDINKSPDEDEGSINKQILLSIGSMAQLKHPRKFWPKVSSASIQLIEANHQVWGEAYQMSAKSQIMDPKRTRNVFAQSHQSPTQVSA
jgi:hypothetical protein